MAQSFWTEGRIAGTLLVLSMLILIGLGIMVALRPDFPAVRFISGELEGVADHLNTERWFLLLWGIAMLCTLLGLGMLTVMLNNAGDRLVSTLALMAMLVVGTLWAVEIAFHLSVTRWAALETARTGSTPDIYEPLRHWVSVSNQLIYIVLGMLSMSGYGWAIRSPGLLPALVGWAAIGWGLIWLLMTIASQNTIPATIFVMPAVFGIALLARG